MKEIQKAIIDALLLAPERTIFGEFLTDQYDQDEFLDAVFVLKDLGRLTGKFPPNPNRRQGSDFGWVRLL